MVRAFLAAGMILAMTTMASAGPRVAPAVAVIRGHTVTHAPTGLTIRVPRTATFIGKERWDLYGVADAEIEVFAEADRRKRLTKLYWIQFEHPWPSEKWRYDYSGDHRGHHWGTTIWVNSGPGSTKDTGRPGSHREHVQKMLERAGYTIPSEMMNVRIIQLLDDPKGTGHGGSELMFIYAEDLARSGRTLAELTDDKGENNAAWTPIGKALEKRAVNAFQVTRR